MKRSIEELKQDIADGEIAAISVDTSVFVAQQLGFEYGLLRRLRQFKGGNASFVLTDVVIREALLHLSEMATNAQADTRKAFKAVGHLWAVSPNTLAETADNIFGGQTASEVSSRRIQDFIAATDAEIVRAESFVKVADLVARYFDRQPPFGEKESAKHEFPDALALLTLEAWAERANTKVLVVSRDSDWSRYCEASNRLVHIGDLGVALSAFQREVAQYTCTLLTQQLRRGDPLGVGGALEAALEDQGWKIDFTSDADSQFYYEETSLSPDLSFEEIKVIGDGPAFEPVEYGDGFLVTRVTAVVEADITATFSFKHWDGIDNDYVSMGTGTARKREAIGVDFLVTFRGDLPDDMAIDEVEVIEKRERVFFGEVEPDWMANPEANE